MVFLLDCVVVTVYLADVRAFQNVVSLNVFMLIFQFFQFMLGLLQLILAAAELSLGCFCVASPFLNLGTELAFEFKFLLLDVLNIMLELDVFIFVLKLSLPVLFVLSANDSFLFEVFGFQIFSKLINLSIQRINHLVFAFHNILKLHFLSQCLVDLI